jgi:hypothetical protein
MVRTGVIVVRNVSMTRTALHTDAVAALCARYRPATARASEAHNAVAGWSVLGPHGIGNRRFWLE